AVRHPYRRGDNPSSVRARRRKTRPGREVPWWLPLEQQEQDEEHDEGGAAHRDHDGVATLVVLDLLVLGFALRVAVGLRCLCTGGSLRGLHDFGLRSRERQTSDQCKRCFAKRHNEPPYVSLQQQTADQR